MTLRARLGNWLRSPSQDASRQRVFVYETLCLLLLWALALLYFKDKLPIEHTLGPMPLPVPWFGALGAVLISLAAVFDFTGKAWRTRWELWHYSRPVVGATVAIVAVLIFQAGILSIGSDPTPSSSHGGTKDIAFYVIGFIVGYREATFRELVKRVVDVILSPGTTPAPVIATVTPKQGPLAGGEISITGSGLGRVLSVRVGSQEAEVVEGGDNQLIVRLPTAASAGVVPITIETQDGSVAAEYEYQ